MRVSIHTLTCSLLLLTAAACEDEHHGEAGGARFFLPTGEATNTTAPTLVTDAHGDLHAVYPRYAGGDAFYAFCGADCAGAEDVAEVTLPTEGTVDSAMLALDAEGRPRVLLSTLTRVYYASCDADCTRSASWRVTPIVDHGGKKDVTGSSFALDGAGRPRFLLHTRVTYLGIGQGAPQTEYVMGEGELHEPSAWTAHVVSDQIWYRGELKYDAADRPHVAAVIADFPQGDGSFADWGAYITCAGDCTTAEGWHGIALAPAYESETEAISIRPSVALALTSAGAPRVLVLARGEDGGKNVDYFACDRDCAGDHWTGSIISSHEDINDGLDLALDASDHPRLVYTLNYNIGLASCDEARCEADGAKWDLVVVESGGDIPTDDIFLYENCNVGAWFLHAPSLALTADGQARVGYQIRDVSGGWSMPNPNAPACTAGTDLSWSRLALLPAVK